MKRAPTIEVFTFMAKHGLTLVDLTEVGGEDLKSPNPKKAEKARRVEKCWSLMARLGIKFRDLENSPQPIPDKPSRRRRGEGHFSEVSENIRISAISVDKEPNEINDLTNSAPVGSRISIRR